MNEIIKMADYEYSYKGNLYFAVELATPGREKTSDILAVFLDGDTIALIDYIYGVCGMTENEIDNFVKECILQNTK